jgi:hypothetical protein
VVWTMFHVPADNVVVREGIIERWWGEGALDVDTLDVGCEGGSVNVGP